ncbi:hypothetical protein PLESTB_000950500 [Pleodorina starrii]|uniref:Uncharacterized protein n=1 Tax=Pleodorina starrii TaxID=330485 RepID=A0A9W6BP45_9CHLO|nr:hypothetical protein PLESTM_001148300 [Pleodorina starrii]GLC55162.1 hypothetical protein PLESTB_000950500 [Pleodorina starrii]GLC71085.1 hypothetical protein PLESTF_001073000 [Pleodorina starrii]
MASCAICDKPALFRCGKCKVERYCSRECQKDHWPHHKGRCAQLGAAARAAADRPPPPPPPDAAEAALRRLEPQPPPQPPPLHPQPPLQPAARERSGSFRGPNPRTARLLGELPPSLQPAAAAADEAAAASADTSIPRSGSGGNSGGGGGGGSQGSAAATGTGAAAAAEPAPGGPSTSSSSSSAPQRANEAGGSAPSPPSPPPPSPPSQPPSHLQPSPPPQSPLGPRTPLPMQPAPPLGSPGGASGGRAAMLLARSQRRELAPAAAATGGELQVEGRGGLLRSGGSSTSGGSILDRVMPPLTPPPPSGPAVIALTAAAAAGAAQAQPSQRPPAPPSAAAAAASDASAVEAPPPALQQQAAAWPWTARSLAGAAAAKRSGSAAASPAGSCLSDLPPEVLLEVLKVLPARSLAAAAAVCRSWRRAAREPWLWVRQFCAAGYPLPAAAYVALRHTAAPRATAEPQPAARDGDGDGDGDAAVEVARAVPGVRGIRAVRAVRAAGGSSHEHFLGGLRAGFLDRLQHNQQHQQQHQQHQQGRGAPAAPGPPAPPPPPPAAAAAKPPLDLQSLYGRTVRMESNWLSARCAETALREHSSNVECVAFQHVEPWGGVMMSAAWDGSVRLFSLGPPGGVGSAPQQARCVRRYRGHTGWITCMAAGRHQVVTASTDRRVAAWRYYSESTDPWVTLEHPQEVTLVRFCYAPPPPETTRYSAHQIACQKQQQRQGQRHDRGGDSPAVPAAAGAALQQQQQPRRPAAATAAAQADELDDAGPCESDRVLSCGYGSREAAAAVAALPYDPQWEDWVVTGCIDGVIRLWHLPTKQLLRSFSGHGDVVWGIAVLYGSSVMVSSSRDCTTRLWRLPPYSEMQAAVAAPPPLPDAAAGGGGGGGGDATGLAAAAAAGRVQVLEPLATLCDHTAAILCMDVHRVPPGIVQTPPAAAAALAADAAGGGGGAARAPSGVRGAPHAPDLLPILASLMNTPLVEPPAAAGSGGGGGDPVAAAAAPCAAGAALPVWLVATGGADAVVRVWNLATAACHATLRGHSVGVLSVQFGYLPRRAASDRDQQLLPSSLDMAAAKPPPPLALPPGQYGHRPPQRLPPSQRLVLVTGSVREVRVWDPVEGLCLAQLADHSGPVTSLALVHGALVTLAMNDGLIVYKCNGMDNNPHAAKPPGAGGTGVVGSTGTGAASAPAAAAAAGGATPRPGGSSAGQLLRREVAAQWRPLEPVMCLQDPHHRSFSAALAVQLEGLAVGSGTGDITYLDFRSRAPPLPALTARRRLLL